MKILWLAHRDPLNPRAGGAERTIYEVCTRLTEKGHKITLLTGGWGDSKSNENLKGFTICRYGKNVGPHLALPLYLLKNKFDLVVNDLGHAIPWVSSSILSKHNIVFFRHLHARSLPGQVNILLAKLITAIEKSYFIIFNKAIFVTESSTSRSDLINLKIKNDKIVIIHPGVDHELFKHTKKTEYPSIVYFGGMRRYKRPEESIYLLRNLLREIQGIKLVIVGTGPEKEKLERLSKKFKLGNSITFAGRTGNKELSKIVASSWLNIHSSVTEGWGYSILEASSTATPTVAYDVPGIVDAIENGVNGIKVKDRDRKALTEAALKILKEPEPWWSSSVKVANKYSWEATTKKWEELILSVVSG